MCIALALDQVQRDQLQVCPSSQEGHDANLKLAEVGDLFRRLDPTEGSRSTHKSKARCGCEIGWNALRVQGLNLSTGVAFEVGEKRGGGGKRTCFYGGD